MKKNYTYLDIDIWIFFTDIRSFTLYTVTSVRMFSTLFFSLDADKENLFANQRVPSLATISFTLMTLVSDSRVIFWREIRW